MAKRKQQIKISLPVECVAWLDTQIGDRSDVIYRLLVEKMQPQSSHCAATTLPDEKAEPSGFDMWQ